jgi:hypothetical protein
VNIKRGSPSKFHDDPDILRLGSVKASGKRPSKVLEALG